MPFRDIPGYEFCHSSVDVTLLRENSHPSIPPPTSYSYLPTSRIMASELQMLPSSGDSVRHELKNHSYDTRSILISAPDTHSRPFLVPIAVVQSYSVCTSSSSSKDQKYPIFWLTTSHVTVPRTSVALRKPSSTPKKSHVSSGLVALINGLSTPRSGSPSSLSSGAVTSSSSSPMILLWTSHQRSLRSR